MQLTPPFMEPEFPLPWSQEPATGAHPESDESHPIYLRSVSISFHLRRDLPSGLFPSGCPIKILYVFLISPMRATCPVLLVLILLLNKTQTAELY